jgi:hypothetical protein
MATVLAAPLALHPIVAPTVGLADMRLDHRDRAGADKVAGNERKPVAATEVAASLAMVLIATP